MTISREVDDGETEEEDLAEIGSYGVVGEVALLKPDGSMASATVAVQSETLRYVSWELPVMKEFMEKSPAIAAVFHKLVSSGPMRLGT